jgi:SAM-dependent methyltransferase
MTAEPVWQRYLTDYNEGLGLVYERFVLNDFLMGLREQYGLQDVLEAPVYGMAGVTGINSVVLADAGCQVTLLDDHPERLEAVARIWKELGLPATFVPHGPWADPTTLPFADRQFDLTWNWAALWYLPDAGSLLREMVRVSRRLVFVAMPNPVQVGYIIRKWLVEPEFFKTVDEKWTSMRLVKQVLAAEGVQIVAEGVLDVPPWPDTVMPAADFLKKVGIRSKRLESRFTGKGWEWSTMDYYLGRAPDLRDRVMRYAWLDHLPLPWRVKAVWAHHHYVLGIRPDTQAN